MHPHIAQEIVAFIPLPEDSEHNPTDPQREHEVLQEIRQTAFFCLKELAALEKAHEAADLRSKAIADQLLDIPAGDPKLLSLQLEGQKVRLDVQHIRQLIRQYLNHGTEYRGLYNHLTKHVHRVTQQQLLEEAPDPPLEPAPFPPSFLEKDYLEYFFLKHRQNGYSR